MALASWDLIAERGACITHANAQNTLHTSLSLTPLVSRRLCLHPACVFTPQVREIVNGWKASPAVARVALSPSLGRAASELLSWPAGARIAQDDVLWKPPGTGGVGYHTDAVYISDQFTPRDDNSVTVWIALDDADESTGTVEYAVGSHKWREEAARRASNTNGTATAATDDDTSAAGTSAGTAEFHGSAGDVAAPAYAAASLAGLTRSQVELRSVSVPRGAAVFHHQDVWHGSRANTHATRPRRALAVHLLRADVAFRSAPPPDYIYGRYVPRRGSPEVSETFFPVTCAPAENVTGLESGATTAERPPCAYRSDAVRELERRGLVRDPELEGQPGHEPSETLVSSWLAASVDDSTMGAAGDTAVAGMLATWRDGEQQCST